MSYDKLCLKWAIIYSVPEQEKVKELSDFTKWFMEQLVAEARQIGIYLNYHKEPSLEQYVAPGDMQACLNAYERIHKEYPSAQFVIHVLPHPKSDEYEWMKTLAARFGLVRQGLLADNCFNKYADTDLVEVCRNITQWMSRSAHKIATSRNSSDKPFDLTIGSDDGEAYSFCKTKMTYHPGTMQSAVNQILHGNGKKAFGREESAVRVEGLPATLNEFGIAQLFGQLCVTGVSLMPGSAAIVAFVNKFHAMQATELDKKVLDRHHTLRIVPLAEDVLEEHMKAESVVSH